MTRVPPPLADRSLPVLLALLRTWKARRATRRARLAAVKRQRASLHPRTKLTPARKRHELRKWVYSVRQANRTILAINEAIAWKRMPMRARALAVARDQLGVLERGGNNRGPEVEAIIRANGGVPGEPWCADFDAFCYRKAGSRAVQRAWAAVRNLGFLAGMRVLRTKLLGLAGDIVCYTFDHTGLLVCYCDASGRPKRAADATHVRAIEGNTGTGGAVSDSSGGGDGVHERIRPLSQVSRMVRVTR